MKDTLELRCLVEALSRFTRAEAEERTAREAHVGYSWDHFGQHLIRAREMAAEDFGSRLDDYIDKRIEAATGARP